MDRINMTRTAANTNEQVIFAGRCVLHALLPEATTTGTITLRDSATAAGSTALHIAAIGLTQAGKDFKSTIFNSGLTVQLSAGATDRVAVLWSPSP